MVSIFEWETWVVRNIREWVAFLEWSPDMSKIAFDIRNIKGELDHDIYVIDVPSGK